MKLLSLLVGVLAITSAFGACESTWIGKYSFLVSSGSGQDPDAVQTYCSTIRGYTSGTDDAKVCCTAATIDAIGDSANQFKTTLSGLAGTRDEDLLAARKRVVGANTTLIALAAAIEAASDKIEAGSNTNKAAIQAFETNFNTAFTAVITNYDTFRTGFTTYQNSRATCMDALIQTQAAIWCGACDSDSAGWVSSAVELGTTITTALNTACLSYITNSASQSHSVFLDAYKDVYGDLTNAFNKIANDDETGYTDFVTARATVTEAEIPVAITPANCDSTGCAWINELFGTDGILANTTAIRGGDEFTQFRRVLSNSRVLALGYALDESGYTPAFPPNPADVENTDDRNSAFRVGVFSCIAAIFVALLF